MTTAASPRRSLPPWLPVVAVLLAHLALAFALFAPAWAHPTTTLIGDQLDSAPHAWLLAWPGYAIAHGHNPLFSDWIGAPTGANLAWSAQVTLPGLASSPIRAVSGPVVAFNLVMTLGPALTAFTAYLLARRFGLSHLAAALGSLVAGFTPYVTSHAAAGHANLVTVLGVPLLALLLDSIVVRQGRAPWLLGALLGLLAAAQAYTAEEVLATEAIAACVGLAALALVAGRVQRDLHVRRAARRLLRALAVAAPVALVLIAPLLWMQFLGPQRITGALQPQGVYVTDLANLVVPTQVQAIAPDRAQQVAAGFSGNSGEWSGYVGLPLLVLAGAVAVWQRHRLLVRWAAITAAAMAVLSLGPRLHIAGHVTAIPLPWRAVSGLPLLDSVLPGRLMLYVFVLLALLLAVFVDALRSHGIVVTAAGAALLTLVAISLAPRLPFPTQEPDVPRFFTTAAVQHIPDGATALILPSVTQQAMLWQAEAGMRFRMVGGWFFAPDAQGHVHDGPPSTPLSDAVTAIEAGAPQGPPLNDDTRNAYRDQLRRDGVTAIVVTPQEPNHAAVVEFFTQLAGTPPLSDGAGTDYWIT
jgi:hypothetical protein